ncbi:MAG TPA: 23S rRNA (uracil(1939)-C(5))-methyltransferase RlmD [Chitinophagaceae bacterium]|nr:23S rRNA (uracil(1939)-C(5))-methyltransferase RlmD [Chitinophagaceae bacterium]
MARKKNKVRVLEKVRVEEYAAEGRSLARVDGKVVFIERTVPGDVVDVFLSKSKKDWAEGYPRKFHELSSRRVIPFCQHFGNCGGCQWQMVPYEEQLKFKQQQVVDALQRIAKVALPEIPFIIGAKEDRYFRNKLEYTFSTKRYVPDGEFQKIKAPLNPPEETAPLNPPEGGSLESSSSETFLAESSKTPPSEELGEVSNLNALRETGAVGFHAKGWFDKVVDITTCYLQSEPNNQVREAIRDYAVANKLSFYDVRQHTGFLRNVQLRVCTTGEVMVNVIVGENDKEKIDALLHHLQQTIPSVTTWVYTINTKWNDSLYDLEPITWSGKGYVIEKLSTGCGGEEFQFKIGPKSFFQTNTKQAEQLYRITRDFAELSGNEIVYDLYCGTGSIGIFVSEKAKKVIGVEMIEAAIEDARENAVLNGLNKTEFIAGDVIDICNDEFFDAHGHPDVIITDPPRAGMHEKLVRKILEIGAPTMVYVSCNPATQARDLRLLDEKYAVTKVQPVDMFPHTHHIENVVQLKLRTVQKIL